MSRSRRRRAARLWCALRTMLDLVVGDGRAAGRAVARLPHVHARVSGEVHDPDARRASGAERHRAPDRALP